MKLPEIGEWSGKKNRVVLGYDLGSEFSQISYYVTEKGDPETVSVVAGEQQYNFPTVLGKRLEVNQWVYGKEALQLAQDGEGILVDNLLKLAREGEQIEVGGSSFDPIALLALFMKKSLNLLGLLVSVDKADALMITVENLDHVMVEVLKQAVQMMQLKIEHIFFQDHIESFYDYTIHQEEALWKHEVLLCDFEGEQLRTYRLECNRRTTPVVAFVEDEVYPEISRDLSGAGMLSGEEREQLDRQFLQAAQKLCNGRIVSTVYLIGRGFEGDWCRESLRYLCRGRRIFQGNNLYSKGACFAAGEKLVPSSVGKEHVFLGKDKLKANLGMKVLRRGEPSYFAILDAGINWFDAKAECEFILESGYSFRILVTPLTGRDAREVEIIMGDMPERKMRATRLHMELSMKAENKVQIILRDMGFGEIYPATGQTWQEEFEI